ncbi:cytochrome c family protein [Pikeienuella piscinae]|uniref:Cytochrome c family protein n=1 Tax=Pikeienuella piscinae TaxID=2748098 RepID=A0A7L5BU16_9RHOB|nr:cytochrome c family protein [Pikeienuella piscinae]QIE54403.1 cytochrome c family protein [Pikeienuella piscinae]
MELNKVIGALCSTLLVFLGLGFFSELIFESHHHEELAFALAVEDSGGGGEEQALDIGAVFAAADPASGEKIFKKCQACHKLEDGANSTGPYLWGVVDRPIDAADGYDKYTGALLQMGEKWTPENLFHFLENPRKTAPGTAMSFAGLKKPEDRADLIAYLNEVDGTPEPLPQPQAETAGDATAPEGGAPAAEASPADAAEDDGAASHD